MIEDGITLAGWLGYLLWGSAIMTTLTALGVVGGDESTLPRPIAAVMAAGLWLIIWGVY